MNASEFYDYIIENFSLSGEACRLVDSIICYVASQGFVDKEEEHNVLEELLDGIGLERSEIDMSNF